MLLLVSKSNDLAYHGTVGIPTNLVDCSGKQLHIGDSVVIVRDNCVDCTVVCEENPEINNYSGVYQRYIYGLRSAYNDEGLEGLSRDEALETLSGRSNGWNVYKVKSYEDLVPNEIVGGNLRVYEVKGDRS